MNPLRRWSRAVRPQCCECGTPFGLMEWFTATYICAPCAFKWGYYEVVQSIAEWLNDRKTQ